MGLGCCLGLAQIPVFQQLGLMQFRPIQNQLSRPEWQGAVTNAQTEKCGLTQIPLQIPLSLTRLLCI